ncbi:MAG TPA: Ig-like domain-containing protein [Candidatus Acidoferrales bacterium]|nr:Ig-like domain-containing protein [Candidatus Acidoferrales bacterium]
MNIKSQLICVLIVTVLSLCPVSNVAAAPVSKLTPEIHSNYAGDLKGGRQTYIIARFFFFAPTFCGEATILTMEVGQSIHLKGVLSYDTPPTNSTDYSHGIPYKTLNIQSLNSDGETWSTVGTLGTSESGAFDVKLTPTAVGVYTYWITYDGDSQYAPAVSNVVTLTVTNMAIS